MLLGRWVVIGERVEGGVGLGHMLPGEGEMLVEVWATCGGPG